MNGPCVLFFGKKFTGHNNIITSSFIHPSPWVDVLKSMCVTSGSIVFGYSLARRWSLVDSVEGIRCVFPVQLGWILWKRRETMLLQNLFGQNLAMCSTGLWPVGAFIS